MEKLKRFWSKTKWYILAAFAVLILALIIMFGGRKPKVVQTALKTVFEGQKKLVEKELAEAVIMETKTTAELQEIDDRLREIDERIEQNDERVDAMDLLELAATWKSLGM